MRVDGMVGWYHQLHANEFDQAPADGEGQGGLVCCSSWGHKESITTERLNSKSGRVSIGFQPSLPQKIL